MTRRKPKTCRHRPVCRRLVVSSLSKAATRGYLRFAGLSFPCALGRAGRQAFKKEGDGATPAGVHGIRQILYRPDRVLRPRTGLPVRAIRRSDGWCDASADRNYNRLVWYPYSASAEALWREDELYDVIVVLDYNARPRVRGRGSAIFMHLARPDYAPTAGCIGLTRRKLLMILARLKGCACVHVPS